MIGSFGDYRIDLLQEKISRVSRKRIINGGAESTSHHKKNTVQDCDFLVKFAN
jgi:hypothetical protein